MIEAMRKPKTQIVVTIRPILINLILKLVERLFIFPVCMAKLMIMLSSMLIQTCPKPMIALSVGGKNNDRSRTLKTTGRNQIIA